MIIVIDNFDSFTFNLVQALEAADASVRVFRNDAIDGAGIAALADDRLPPLAGIVLSPGPGDPSSSGASMEAIAVAAERRIPLLGVCLGMQALGAYFGASIVRAPTLVHGEASQVHHDDRGLLRGLPSPFPAARYHSLCIDRRSLPAELEVTAVSDEGVMMGVRHRRLPLEGVQFHPESILTPDGPKLLAAFLRLTGEGRPELLESGSDFAFRGIAGIAA